MSPLKSPVILAARAGLIAALLAATPAAAQPASAYNGDWAGALSAGGQTLHLVLHVKTEGATQTAELDSVDQGATIPAAAIKTDGGQLSALFMAVGGELTAKLSEDGKTLTGTWTQGQVFPLVLTKK
jgi:hypothetical protein